jgi:two-component system nitrogen regulation sensor histidine kinase NtrY
MKLRTKFILFIVIIHALTIGLSYFVFRENKLVFIASEFFILVSLAICWSLYNDLIRPLKLLLRGIDAIRDRDFNVKFVETGKYEMDQLIGVYNHMIDQLRRERTMQQEQHFFLEKLVDTSPLGILLLDFDSNISGINPKAAELLGRPKAALLGRALNAVDHPVLEAVAALPTGESRTLPLQGAKIYKIQKAQFIDRGFPRVFVLIEELTAEILEAEKRSYGKVIRMMAHEVNNSIGAVNSILDTTLQLGAGAPDVQEALKVAIERNDHLNHFMRNFADVIRLPEPRPETFDLHELLRKTARLMEYKAREAGVRFELDLAEKPFPVRADMGQLEQVLINVVKNAVEAANGDGRVVFQTTLKPRQLLIRDNGKGIPKALEDKIFSPFFTDKNGGQGVGLTLAREILSAHGFAFSLRTEEDGWTEFRIELVG